MLQKTDLHINDLDSSKLNLLDDYIKTIEDPEGCLINILHKAQHIFGYIPKSLQLYIARAINVGAAKVNGVVSFYSYFSEEQTGKHLISVCMGTACYVKGGEKVLHQFLKELDLEKNQVSEDGLFTIRDVRCIGACGLAPVVTVGEKVYGHVKEEQVKDIILELRGGNDGN
jgi:NADH:ubiquinone oxidoreductase subunit E